METKLLRGVIEQESAFHAVRRLRQGRQGPDAAHAGHHRAVQGEDAFDAQQNIEAGATFLKQLLDKYKGDIKLALAAYNAGPAAVDKTGAIPEIKETQDYVERIMKKVQ